MNHNQANIFLPTCFLFLSLALSACGGGGGSDDQDNGLTGEFVEEPADDGNVNTAATQLDNQLRALIAEQELTGDPSTGRNLPDISAPLPQLGMRLFFSKSLGGEFDSACVSCHHPTLGGSDQLSLPVGVEAVFEDLLGPGREHVDGPPPVPRNAPTTFNSGLWDMGMFHDSRVESLDPTPNANGANGEIRTPDTAFGIADNNAGANLPTAQARFPVTSAEEMRTSRFESGASNDDVRNHLAARLGNYGIGINELDRNEWLPLFQAAFGNTSDAESLITYDNIALAIAEYERSQNFVDTPWRDYVQGDNTAISDNAKRGAISFYTSAEENGGNCFACHGGDKFTAERHATVAFPQIGPGKGDGNDDDFGRERETGDAEDRYRFRVPSLLNVALTAPYGHAGAYQSLNQVLDHYNNPRGTVDNYFDNGGWCQQPQFRDLANCPNLYPNARQNSQAALAKLGAERDAGTSRFPNLNLDRQQRNDIIAFLNTLTDRCASNDSCIRAWIPPNDNGPDDQQLVAVDINGNPL